MMQFLYSSSLYFRMLTFLLYLQEADEADTIF